MYTINSCYVTAYKYTLYLNDYSQTCISRKYYKSDVFIQGIQNEKQSTQNISIIIQ
jgi:hypothetical protein